VAKPDEDEEMKDDEEIKEEESMAPLPEEEEE